MNHARIKENLELRLSQADRDSPEWWLYHTQLSELEADTHGVAARRNLRTCQLIGVRHLRAVR